MQKQQLIGIILISLILFIYLAYIVPQYYTPPEQPVQDTIITEDTPDISISPELEPAIGHDTPAIITNEDLPFIEPALIEEIIVETDLYRATFSNLGAQLTSFKLKQIAADKSYEIPVLEEKLQQAELQGDTRRTEWIRSEISKIRMKNDLIQKEQTARENGNIDSAELYRKQIAELTFMELIPFNPNHPKPFEIKLSGIPQSDRIILYSVSSNRLELDENNPKGELIFSGIAPNGLKIVKSISFTNDNYILGYDLTVSNPTDNMIRLLAGNYGMKIHTGTGIGELNTQAVSRYESGVQAISKIDNEIRQFNLSAQQTEIQYTGEIDWAAIQTNFFFKGLIPQISLSTTAIAKIDSLDISFTPQLWLKVPPLDIPVQYQIEQSFKYYIGPKKLENLTALNVPVQEILFPGWLQTLNLWILIILQWFYRLTHNYGIAIILISVLIRIITFPLTHISFRSMKRMQMLAPEMKSLQEKYKDDPARQQKELMALYKKYKVNPMSGCLPLLIQMPIFIALYNVLWKIVELRGAPFIFWIQDLSRPDTIAFLFGFPINILPLLMAATMWLQQKMTTTTDPKMAMMAPIMTIVFLFIFWNMPSGLVLYWFISNLLSILQQHYINKQAIPISLPHKKESSG